MEVSSQSNIPLKLPKLSHKKKVRTSIKNKQKFCPCCHRLIDNLLPCNGKFSKINTSEKDCINDNQEALLPAIEKTVTEIEQKCKCIKQVLCKSIDSWNYSKSINSDQEMAVDKLQYLCGVPSNLTLKTQDSNNYSNENKDSRKIQMVNNEPIKKKQSKKFQEFKSASACRIIDNELEKVIQIVQEQFAEELKNIDKNSNFCSTLDKINNASTFYNPEDSFDFSSDSMEVTFSNNVKESTSNNCCEDDSKESHSTKDRDESLDRLMDTEKYYCFNECEKNTKWNCVKKSQHVEEAKLVLTCGQTMKICKHRVPIILQHCGNYKAHFCCDNHVEPFTLGHLGKSAEIGKWGNCFDLADRVLSEKVKSKSSIKTEKTEVCFRDGTCIDVFDNVNRFEGIGNNGFAILCRKLMRWTHYVTKTWRETRKYPHVVVHLPSFTCPDDMRCRAKKTYQSLQNIQIGRLGWLENDKSQVLYVCPDNMNLDICLLKKLVSTVRPDINLDNLWLIKPEKKNHRKKCSSGCENLFSTPATYRRIRYLTAGRQAFIVPGILDEKNIFIACELKIAILGPCLIFQNRLLCKKYVMDVLHEAEIDHPPFIDVKNFKNLCENLSRIILKFPIYKLWFIKINIGYNGYQTAIFQINKTFYKCNEEELKSKLFDLLPKELQLKEEIYRKPIEFFNDLERYGGIVQACPNRKYHVISLGLLNEHDTAKPLLITTSDVIQIEKDIRTNVGYIIPQSKISSDALEKLVNKIGKALLDEQYIGFYGVDVLVFKNESNVQELWVVNVNPYYTDLLSFHDWKKFCSKQCKCCPLPEVKNYAVCSGKLYISGLSKYSGEELIAFCEAHNIYYKHKEKSGCILYPIDFKNRAMFVFSLNSSRKLAIEKFTEALRTLCKLSLGKPTDILKTNMNQLAKELEKNELANSTT